VPLWRGAHVGAKQLAEDFATYLYLPRLCDDDVLLEGIRDGLARLMWKDETFAYADSWDDQKKKYIGLQVGMSVLVVLGERSVVVKPDVATSLFEAEKAQREAVTTQGEEGKIPKGEAIEGKAKGEVTHPPLLRRFHGSVVLDATRLGRDASRIAEEVVQHFSGMVGSRVEIVLEIRAEVPEGVPDRIVRTVTENCRALKFKSSGFEEE